MSTHKCMDKLCLVAVLLALLLVFCFINGEALGIQAISRTMGYEQRLFDTSQVHTIAIVMDDWEGFLETCENEEYTMCSVVIDGTSYKNVGIRAKGNTSLSNVSRMNSDRYSFKIEFDHYDSNKSYYGLDKLCLNNIIQDNTYMKDHLTYQMMGDFGVNAPLSSYAYLTVNGEDWGLYLAVEALEDGFLQRNYGNDSGELYKPDSTGMGGGRGEDDGQANKKGERPDGFGGQGSIPQATKPENEMPPNVPMRGEEAQDISPKGEAPQNTPAEGEAPQNAPAGGQGGRGDRSPGGGMGSSDVKLQYTDDDPESYANIFNNAKTDCTDADKARLIASLKDLNEGENIEKVVAVEEVIRYFVVHNFVCNGDSYTGSIIHNYYLYEKDGQLSMLPWDYNLAFGSFQSSNAGSTVNSPIDTPVSGGTGEDRPMIHWIFADETYTQQYHKLFAQFLDTTDVMQRIEETAALIAPYVEKDPTKFCTYEEFETGVAALQEFCQLRLESVRGQLDGTIPSTKEGQAAEPTALVDASSLNLSDMGSMGMGGRGTMGGKPEDTTMPELGGNSPAGSQPPNGEGTPDNPPGGGETPDPEKLILQQGGGFPGGWEGRTASSAADSGNSQKNRAGILLLGSLLTMAMGLLVAIRYRR